MALHPEGDSEQPWIKLARNDLGVSEKPGKLHNPIIQQYYADCGESVNTPDEVAWCAAFVGSCLKRAGYPNTGQLLARSYLKYGKMLEEPKVGCIAIFPRGNSTWQGHVGFVVGVSSKSVKILGGNQSDKVSIVTYSRGRALGWRWPVKPTVPDLRANGSKDIQASDVLVTTGAAGAAVTSITKTVESIAPAAPAVPAAPPPLVVPSLESSMQTATEHLTVTQQLLEGADAVGKLVAQNTWVIAVALGALCIVLGWQLRQTRVSRAERGDLLSS